jgi:hypothetical protein
MPIEIRELTVKAVVGEDDAAALTEMPAPFAALDRDPSVTDLPPATDPLLLLLDDGV